MTVVKTFTTDKEADLWIKMNSKKLKELEFTKINLKNFGTAVFYKTKNLEKDDILNMLKELEPNEVREGQHVHEGTAKEIAGELDMDSSKVMAFLRANRKHDCIDYSGDGEIKPQVNRRKSMYWRIALEQPKKKLTFNKR